MRSQTFTVTLVDAGRGRIFVPVPFDPDQVWHTKTQHHITGTVNGVKVRGTVNKHDDGFGFVLGALWSDCGAVAGDTVEVTVAPEGPQRTDLAPDIAAALAADPEAGAFFDALAQFYRKAYLRWIESTKRRPELRPIRIAEMVRLLRAGIKERP